MHKAFTLIELLVVLTIITLVMGVVVPKGTKMLTSYERTIEHSKALQTLSQTRNRAFLQVRTFDITIQEKHYHITPKGIINEKSNDNH